MFVTSYSVTYCIYIPGNPWFCVHYYWWVQIVGYVLACRSYSFVCTLHHIIIIIVQTYLKTLNLLNACQIYFVECVSKIKHITSVIHYAICEAVRFQFTHFPCDDWENIYILCLAIPPPPFHTHKGVNKSFFWTLACAKFWTNSRVVNHLRHHGVHITAVHMRHWAHFKLGIRILSRDKVWWFLQHTVRTNIAITSLQILLWYLSSKSTSVMVTSFGVMELGQHWLRYGSSDVQNRIDWYFNCPCYNF